MPIPAMLASPATLPPFTGADPTLPEARSPYKATMEEVVDRFGASKARRVILNGLIGYRRELRRLPLNGEFQWLAGSFVENPGREPNDVDVVTFYRLPGPDVRALLSDPERRHQFMRVFGNPRETKTRFHCDAYSANLMGESVLVANTHYFYGLFSHQRNSYAWKGIIEVELASPDDDRAVENLLASMEP